MKADKSSEMQAGSQLQGWLKKPNYPQNEGYKTYQNKVPGMSA
jgi:hypothetical protein